MPTNPAQLSIGPQDAKRAQEDDGRIAATEDSKGEYASTGAGESSFEGLQGNTKSITCTTVKASSSRPPEPPEPEPTCDKTHKVLDDALPKKQRKAGMPLKTLRVRPASNTRTTRPKPNTQVNAESLAHTTPKVDSGELTGETTELPVCQFRPFRPVRVATRRPQAF